MLRSLDASGRSGIRFDLRLCSALKGTHFYILFEWLVEAFSLDGPGVTVNDTCVS